jgi:3-oxoacyl-[acyl-carrier protein] reductase
MLIVGASSDIGLKLIQSIDESCLILAHYNDSQQGLLDLSKNIDNELVMFKADLSVASELISMLDNIERKYGAPDKIVHLAASKFENIRFKDVDWNDFQYDIDVSLRSLVLILNRFLPILAKEKKGKVVCALSSVVLNTPPKFLTQYVTVKYALLGLIKALASEYSSKNIQINSISPSMIETKFLGNIDSRFVELNAYNHPLKRNAKVCDVVPIIKILISKESDYISGVNIPITGGMIF